MEWHIWGAKRHTKREKKSCQQRMLYLAKLSFIPEVEIKMIQSAN